MKPKHIEARIKQCIAISECSPCPRRKFGALLLEPIRNVILMDGYNGGPRGGGGICGGDRCLRDGLKPEEVEVRGPNGVDDHDIEDAWVYVNDKSVPIPVMQPDDRKEGLLSWWDGDTAWKSHGWRDEALAYREKLLAENPPVASGTRYEIGCHHAEMNVITNAAAQGVATAGAWLIVTGEPCILCAKLVHHAGIAKVICVKGGFMGGDDGPKYLRKHNVEVEYVDGPLDPRMVQPVTS